MRLGIDGSWVATNDSFCNPTCPGPLSPPSPSVCSAQTIYGPLPLSAQSTIRPQFSAPPDNFSTSVILWFWDQCPLCCAFRDSSTSCLPALLPRRLVVHSTPIKEPKEPKYLAHSLCSERWRHLINSIEGRHTHLAKLIH